MSDFHLDRLAILGRRVLHAVARRERAGRAPQHLLEPGLATWNEFRGNLNYAHLLALVAEDAAVRFPLPADPSRVLGSGAARDLGRVPNTTVYGWMQALGADVIEAERADALADHARALGLPHRFAGAALHKIQADKQVLELPGTGGQLVARALERSEGAYLHTNTTVLTSTWADRAMAGLVAMEFDAPSVDFVHGDPDLGWSGSAEKRSSFDLVFGLTPERGGTFDADVLRLRFPAATLVLV